MSQPLLEDDDPQVDDAPSVPVAAGALADDDIDYMLPTIEAPPAPVPLVPAAPPAVPVAEGDAGEQALARQNLSLTQQADALVITDAATFGQAEEFLRVLAEAAARVEAFWKEPIANAHAAWKGLTERRRQLLEPIETAKRSLGTRYAAFERAARERAEAERRQAEEAARQAEEQRLRDEAAALEAQAASDETPEYRRDQLLTEAAEVRHEAATVPTPVLASRPAVTPSAGISTRAKWTFEVTDKLALVKAVADGKVSLEALEPNATYLRARATADKNTLVIPGVRVYDAGTTAVRRR